MCKWFLFWIEKHIGVDTLADTWNTVRMGWRGKDEKKIWFASIISKRSAYLSNELFHIPEHWLSRSGVRRQIDTKIWLILPTCRKPRKHSHFKWFTCLVINHSFTHAHAHESIQILSNYDCQPSSETGVDRFQEKKGRTRMEKNAPSARSTNKLIPICISHICRMVDSWWSNAATGQREIQGKRTRGRTEQTSKMEMRKCIACDIYLLIVEHNVGSPNVIGWNVQHFHAAILFRFPAQLVIVPRLKETRRIIYERRWSGMFENGIDAIMSAISVTLIQFVINAMTCIGE